MAKRDNCLVTYELNPKFLHKMMEEIEEILAQILKKINADWRFTTGMES